MQVMKIQRGNPQGLYLAEWFGMLRVGPSQIQLLPSGLMSCCTAPHAAGLVAEGEGRMLLAPAAWGLSLAAGGLSLAVWCVPAQ